MYARKRGMRPITEARRIAKRDEKLWKRELAKAEELRLKTLNCPCTACEGVVERTIAIVRKHLRERGRHDCCRIFSGQEDRDTSDEEWEHSVENQQGPVANHRSDLKSLGMLDLCSPHGDDVSRLSDDHCVPSGGSRPVWYCKAMTENQIALDACVTDDVPPETRFEQMMEDMFGIMPDFQENDNELEFDFAAPEDPHPSQGRSGDLHSNAQTPPGSSSPQPKSVTGNTRNTFKDPGEGFYAEAFQPLFEGSTQTVLDYSIQMVNLFVDYRIPQVYANALLCLLKKKFLNQPNHAPESMYQANSLTSKIGLGFETFHACIGGCVLFRKEHANLIACPVCSQSRYKEGSTKIPVNKVRYFPLIPRLLRMYCCPSLAALMTWSSEHKTKGALVHHAADCEQWKLVDRVFPTFAKEMRNLRFGLLLDGVNPFHVLSASHSVWPIMLVNYGLPPWLLTKPFFVMLSVLVSGKKDGPKAINQQTMNVYLQPLLEELLVLWDEGVTAEDILCRNGGSQFQLYGMLLWTINDYPALGYISGLCVGGNLACSVCGGDAPGLRRDALRKAVRIDARRWLPMDHPWRGIRFAHKFDGKVEDRPPPSRQTAATILERADIQAEYDETAKTNGTVRKKGRPRHRTDPYLVHGVYTRSSLFELEYWEYLPVRHCIDVMHTEKNVCESLCLFLLGTKDLKKVRTDLQDMGVRPELWVDETDGTLPPAAYTLTPRERDIFMKRIQSLKVPSGHSALWGPKVDKDDRGDHKFSNCKSHDFHVLMQDLLPVCLRDLLSDEVRDSVLSLCQVFKRLCKKVYDPASFQQLKADTVITLCKLEMCFPPAFFDVMTHLVLHAVEELEWCGPVQTRWMYFGERMVGHYTKYVKNPANVAGSIAACYIREQTMGFCTEYMSGVEAYKIRVWDSKEDLENTGEVLQGAGKSIPLSEEETNKIHKFVLQTWPPLEPWRRKYSDLERQEGGSASIPFADWVQEEVEKAYESNLISDPDVYHVTRRPLMQALSFQRMWAYGFHYRVNDTERPYYDSGISGVFETPIRRGSDETADVTYVGELTDILSLAYETTEPILLLKAQWVRPNDDTRHPSARTHRDGCAEVNFKQLMKNCVDPYVFPADIHQVYFLHHDNPRVGWRVVLKAEPRSRRSFEDVENNEVAEDI